MRLHAGGALLVCVPLTRYCVSRSIKAAAKLRLFVLHRDAGSHDAMIFSGIRSQRLPGSRPRWQCCSLRAAELSSNGDLVTSRFQGLRRSSGPGLVAESLGESSDVDVPRQ